jgi:hypothetical protein
MNEVHGCCCRSAGELPHELEVSTQVARPDEFTAGIEAFGRGRASAPPAARASRVAAAWPASRPRRQELWRPQMYQCRERRVIK